MRATEYYGFGMFLWRDLWCNEYAESGSESCSQMLTTSVEFNFVVKALTAQLFCNLNDFNGNVMTSSTACRWTYTQGVVSRSRFVIFVFCSSYYI